MSTAGVDMSIYHIDVVLSIVHSDFNHIIKERVHPTMEGMYTIVPTTFFQTISYLWDKGENTADGFGITPIEELCIGVDRWGNSTPWFDLKFVFTVVNAGMHFIICKIDLQNEIIVVYDSIRHRCTPEIEELRKRTLLPLACWLPPILNHAGLTTRKRLWRIKFAE